MYGCVSSRYSVPGCRNAKGTMSAAPVPRGTRLRDVGAYTDEVLFFTEREREKVDGILRSDHRQRGFVEARSA